jgi:BirA family biotin operon repressor/biotin-[acetyl-CoA-carboxylase] ligase
MPTPMKQPMHWGAEALWEQLEPLLPGLSVEVVARSPSTSSALVERARVRDEPANDGVQVRRSVESAAFGRRAVDVQPCLLVAEQQTGGRGRMGRVWQSEAGSSLTFSLSLRLDPPDWSGLSLAVGCAIAEALDPSPAGGAPRIGIKWPNDLWLMDRRGDTDQTPQGRKLGGVLIETVASSPSRLVVTGVGLNVTPLSVEPEVTTGFACLQEIDPQASPPMVLKQIALPLVRALLEFETHGFAPFAARFAARDLLRDQPVTTTQADVPHGTARGVSAGGALRVECGDVVHEVHGGEVSVRLDLNGARTQQDAPC